MSDAHFVVERLNWRRVDGTFYRLPGQTRFAAFDTFDEAEAFRAAEEGRARRVVNPFAGGLAVPFDQTHWQPEVLCDWLMDHGIDPPPPADGKRDWAGWWDREAPGWTDDQRWAAWEPLDKVRFFRLREAPKRPVAYAVVQVDWGYNDEWEYRDGEGGTVETLYRRRERAEAEAAERNRVARGQWDSDTGFDDCRWREAIRDPFAAPDTTPRWEVRSADDVTFYEVVEVELEGEA